MLETPSLNAVRDLAWLRTQDLDTLNAAVALHDDVSLPRSPKLLPVSWVELGAVVASYNAFTRLWNRHETDPRLWLSPAWWDGTAFPHHRLPQIDFRLRAGTLRVRHDRSWYMFHEGLSCQKNELPLSAIRWAGWLRSSVRS